VTEAIGHERKLNMLANLIYHPVEEYIFIESLEEYLINVDSTKEQTWRIKHLENVIWHLEKYENYKLLLTETNASFLFTLKIPKDASTRSAKLTFMGKQIDFFLDKGSGRLAGFATDNQIFIDNFKAEVENIINSVISEYLDRKKLLKYFEHLIYKAKNS